MKETDEERRHRLYGCNGMCYGGHDKDGKVPICGGIDTCPETARQEGVATAVAAIILAVIVLGLLAVGVLGVLGLLAVGVRSLMGWRDMDMFYAIQRKDTKEFVTGTNFSYYPYRQITSTSRPPLLLSGYNLEAELKRRNINLKRYQVVQVNIVPQFPLRQREIEEHAQDWRRSAKREEGYKHGKRKR